jgi:hypothetical protein
MCALVLDLGRLPNSVVMSKGVVFHVAYRRNGYEEEKWYVQ